MNDLFFMWLVLGLGWLFFVITLVNLYIVNRETEQREDLSKKNFDEVSRLLKKTQKADTLLNSLLSAVKRQESTRNNLTQSSINRLAKTNPKRQAAEAGHGQASLDLITVMLTVEQYLAESDPRRPTKQK